MVEKLLSWREVVSLVEAALARVDHPQRPILLHTLRTYLPHFMAFLEYPGPRASDRSQVLSKEVRLPNAPPVILRDQDDASAITLDDQDVQLALKLSDDLNLNEIECVRLLVNIHIEWGLLVREPLEILRLSAGLWFTERRAFINTLFILLWVAVHVDDDVAIEIQKFLEELFKSGLRRRLITLIKELNRDEPRGLGGPDADGYVMDSRATLEQRYNVVQSERLTLSHCVVLSFLLVQIGSQEAIDIVSLLKDCVADTDDFQSIVKLQIAYTIMFGIVIALMSDALSGLGDLLVATFDFDFRREFQRIVMSIEGDATIENFMDVVRLSWVVFMMLTLDGVTDILWCLESDCAINAFKFLTRLLKTPAFQVCLATQTFLHN